MKKIEKTVYIVTGNDKEIEKETLEEAQDIKSFLEDFYQISFNIETRQKIEYEMEKGDKVYWIKNNIPDITRIDEITEIVKNAWGDIVYNTKQLNGSKRGQAYKKDLFLVV